MNDIIVKTYVLSKELEISSRKIDYFTFHLGRCIKFEDKIRLTIFIASQIAYSTAVLIALNNLAKELNSLVFPNKFIGGISQINSNQ
jgi:hypothetical protein